MTKYFDIRVSTFSGEASMKLTKKFNDLDPLMRADLLKDLSYDFWNAYCETVEDWRDHPFRMASEKK